MLQNDVWLSRKVYRNGCIRRGDVRIRSVLSLRVYGLGYIYLSREREHIGNRTLGAVESATTGCLFMDIMIAIGQQMKVKKMNR